MEEDEYTDIVTYIQDQKYPQNANESIKKVPVSQYFRRIIFNIKYFPWTIFQY
jgi:hypothetical protein